KTSGGMPVADDRFVESTSAPFVAIATSSAQNDSGVFELNFHDERYLPFEGVGVISTWQLELNGKYIENGAVADFSQLDYNTITDVVIHVRYTAREDAGAFKNAVVGNLRDYFSPANGATPSIRMFNLRQEFPSQWHRFLN